MDSLCCHDGCYGGLPWIPTFTTICTNERSLPSMDPDMFLDIANLVEVSVTLWACIDTLA